MLAKLNKRLNGVDDQDIDKSNHVRFISGWCGTFTIYTNLSPPYYEWFLLNRAEWFNFFTQFLNSYYRQYVEGHLHKSPYTTNIYTWHRYNQIFLAQLFLLEEEEKLLKDETMLNLGMVKKSQKKHAFRTPWNV